MKILVRLSLVDNFRHLVRDAAGENTVVFANSDEDSLHIEGVDAEVYCGNCSETEFQHLPNVKWMQFGSAGMDAFLYPALRNSDVIVTNGAGLYGQEGAEHAFALLLSLTRGIHHCARNQTNPPADSPSIQCGRVWGTEINGWTLGVIGIGGFGLNMARIGKGFNMHVIAVDAYRTDKPDAVDELTPLDGLSDLMRSADVVMTACPLTAETHHLINADNLALMKPTAYVINVTRGGVIDESALIEALKAGKIAGAGLDVVEIEPLAEDSPLRNMDNVVLSPHWAGISQQSPSRFAALFCENLRRYLNGEPLKNVVDKQLGF